MRSPSMPLCALILVLLFPVLLQAAPLSVGDTAPPGIGKDSRTGDERLLAENSGQITVLHFWASWCDYCFKTLAVMDTLQEQLGPKGLRVVSIAVKDDARTANRITDELKPLAMLSTIDRKGALLAAYGDDYLPNVWIIGRDGRIAGRITVKNDEDLKTAIRLVESALRAPAD